MGIDWKPVKDATSYDVKADGVVYRNLTDPEFLLTPVKNQTKHTFQVRGNGQKRFLSGVTSRFQFQDNPAACCQNEQST